MFERQLVGDPGFSKGFWIKGQRDGDDTLIGMLAPGKGEPEWNLCQWYCGYFRRTGEEFPEAYNFLNAREERTGEGRTFRTASETVTLGPEGIGLRLDASKEFLAPRRQGEPWPHLLLEYRTEAPPRLSELSSLRLELAFRLARFSSHMDREEERETLHTAQFPWYVKIRNENGDSEDFGKFFWFGFHLFDSRYPVTSLFASVDGGKEVHTHSFIYAPGSDGYLAAPTLPGREQRICADILPDLKRAFETARSRGYLPHTAYGDLLPVGGNLGWEITGTYDAKMRVKRFRLYAGLQEET